MHCNSNILSHFPVILLFLFTELIINKYPVHLKKIHFHPQKLCPEHEPLGIFAALNERNKEEDVTAFSWHRFNIV